jgi:hypothetical protein
VNIHSRLLAFELWCDGYGPMPDWFARALEPPTQLPLDWDPNATVPSPPWVATLPHDVVSYEGYEVPVYEGDLERIEWERERRR